MHSSRPRSLVLVTGSPRSGTTALGEALTLGPAATALHEPLNYRVGLKKIDRYFEFVDGPNLDTDKLGGVVSEISALKGLDFKRGRFRNDRGIKGLVKRAAGGRPRISYMQSRLSFSARTLVIKDPFAAFVTGVLANKFGVPALVTVRSPWAVAASFKRLGWGFDIETIANSMWPALPGEASVTEFAPKSDPVANAAQLWLLTYQYILNSSAENEAIKFVNMDAIVNNWETAYPALYSHLGLEWSNRVRTRLLRTMTTVGAGTQAPKQNVPHDKRRDFHAASSYWRNILTPEEISTVSIFCEQTWNSVMSAAKLESWN